MRQAELRLRQANNELGAASGYCWATQTRFTWVQAAATQLGR